MRSDSFHFIMIDQDAASEGGGGPHVKVFDGGAGSSETGALPLTLGLLLPAVQSARQADSTTTVIEMVDNFFG